MIDWKKKLSSRKFWSLLLALIGSVLVVFKIPAGEVEQIIAIIGGFSSVIVYILAEAHVDGKAAGASFIVESEPDKSE